MINIRQRMGAKADTEINWRERVSIINSPELLVLFIVLHSFRVCLQQVGFSFFLAGVEEISNSKPVTSKTEIKIKENKVLFCMMLGFEMRRK